MAIGRTFNESFQKALRGLEVGAFGFGSDSKDFGELIVSRVKMRFAASSQGRIRSAFGICRLRAEERHDDRRNFQDHEHRPLVLGSLGRDRRDGRRTASGRFALFADAGVDASREAKRLLRSSVGDDVVKRRDRSSQLAEVAQHCGNFQIGRHLARPSSKRTRLTTTAPTNPKTKRRTNHLIRNE